MDTNKTSEQFPNLASVATEDTPPTPGEQTFNFHYWPELRLAESREGYALLEMPALPGYLNRGGRLHGGLLYTLADMASGTAVMTYGHRTTTVSGSMDYLRPGIGVTTLFAEGRVIKHGATLSVCEVNIRDQENRLLCTAHMTFFNFPEPLSGTVDERFTAK